MSIRAMNWAMEQATGDPRAQCLLYVIADCANQDGMAFPAIKYMASKSQQSKATVQRRLKELEEMGALARFPRWEDENGKINSEGRGRRTSDEIRLLLDCKIDRSEDPEEGDETDTPPSQADTPPIAPSNPPVSQLSEGGPSHCGDPQTNRQKEPEGSPPTPQGGLTGQGEGEHGEEWPGAETWPEFKSNWREPIQRESIARQVWSVLTDVERRRAITAAAGLHASRGAQRKPPAMQSAQTFLREQGAWADYAKHAPPPPDSIAGTFVSIATDAGRALMALHHIAGQANKAIHVGTGRVIKAAKEVTPRVLALAFSVDADGRRDETKWPLIEPDTKSFYAWCEFVRAEIGLPPKVEDVIVGRITKDEIDPATGQPTGQQIFDRYEKKRGFRAPTLWPPRVDGSLSGSSPVEELSDQDANEFARN